MLAKDIQRHLRSYSIVRHRTTTINHAFAAAIAPHEEYDADKVNDALAILGQDPADDLECAYCGQPAETWDHVHATVKNSNYSGFGHRIANLLPCCKPCNSAKGNKAWSDYLSSPKLKVSDEDRRRRKTNIRNYLSRLVVDPLPTRLPEYDQLQALRSQVLQLLSEADNLATKVRNHIASSTTRRDEDRVPGRLLLRP